MAVSEQQRTFPFPNQKLALSCYQLTVVRGGVGAQLLTLIQIFSMIRLKRHILEICPGIKILWMLILPSNQRFS